MGVVKAFEKFLPTRIEGIVQDIRDKHLDKREIAYWCQDETRIGFKTESGKNITLKRVKPQQNKKVAQAVLNMLKYSIRQKYSKEQIEEMFKCYCITHCNKLI